MSFKANNSGWQKVFLAELSQETNTFLPLMSDVNHFSQGAGFIKGNEVNAPGISGLDLKAFKYTHVPRPIWPLDENISRAW